MWAELTEQYGDEIELILVDRDSPEGRAFADSHRIFYQPGFVALTADGEQVYEGLGPYDPEDVRALVVSVLPAQ